MKKSTSNAKMPATKVAKKTKSPTKPQDKKKAPEIEGLLEAEQPLFYYGPPPAIRQLYKGEGYDKDFHPQDLLKHMQEGSSRSEICAAWGITYSKLNEWLEAFPEMAEAYAVGKPAFDAYYKRALRHSAFGLTKTVRENSLFFMLKNQAGFADEGGGHEFGDGQSAEVEFVDED